MTLEKRNIKQLAKEMKKQFDAHEDCVLDYDLPNKKGYELVITRSSEGEDGSYITTVDLHKYESDDYEMLSTYGSSDLSDFEWIVQEVIDNGENI